MDNDREIEGTEFDWFAVDEHGQFALFATAGYGPVPSLVRGCIASHATIGNNIEVTGLGSTDVWRSYSRVGLFAYDWSASQGRYLRVAKPSAPLSAGLATSLTACSNLPALNLSFAQALAIEPSWQL